jgi:hypothetical protein
VRAYIQQFKHLGPSLTNNNSLHEEIKSKMKRMRWGKVWETTRCIQGFGGGDLRERDQLEGLGTDRGTLLKLIFTKRYKAGGMDSNDLAQDRDR